jgi:dTDP-4-amino-4,6-dideoxygalactose transaminase
MIPLFKVYMSETVPKESAKVLMSGMITQGPIVEKFESDLGKYLGNDNVLTLNSATAGLTLALRILLKPITLLDWSGFDITSDCVLSCPLTCFATHASIMANNVRIKWVDVDINTGNMCMNDLYKKINKTTKVIYIVHWGGNATDNTTMDSIRQYTFDNYGFYPMIIEDCAHSFGAKYPSGKIIGSNSENIQVFSLQAIKLLTTCDGGFITLPNKILYNSAKLLRWYGIDREKRNYKGTDLRLEHDITDYGYKFHMNDVNACIGIENLKDIPKLLAINRRNGAYYDDNLSDISGITLMNKNNNSSYWLYTLRIVRKQEFIEYMKECNIMVSQVHQRNDIFSCLEYCKIELPELNKLEKELVCIPVGWWITNNDRKYIVKCIKNFLNYNNNE